MPNAADDPAHISYLAHRLRCYAEAVRDAAAAFTARANGVAWESPAIAAHIHDEAHRHALEMRAAADRLDEFAAMADVRGLNP